GSWPTGSCARWSGAWWAPWCRSARDGSPRRPSPGSWRLEAGRRPDRWPHPTASPWCACSTGEHAEGADRGTPRRPRIEWAGARSNTGTGCTGSIGLHRPGTVAPADTWEAVWNPVPAARSEWVRGAAWTCASPFRSPAALARTGMGPAAEVALGALVSWTHERPNW